MSRLKVGLVFGGKSAEHEVSLMSARSVMTNINREKYELIPVAISKEGYWLTKRESEELIKSDSTEASVDTNKYNSIGDSMKNFLELDIDLLFPLIHGPYGEDGRIQGFFEILNKPYVGADVLGSALGMDKIKMKEMFAFHGLPQVKYDIINNYQYTKKDDIKIDLDYPCFVKPANMGSSIGITKVYNNKDLNKALKKAFIYDSKVIIEEGIKCREIECSVLGNRDLKASLPGEIKPAHDFYDYEAKYMDDLTRLIIPAELSKEMVKKVQKLAVDAFKAVNCQGFARVDFFINNKDNKIMVNEINTIPGFTEYSMYPKLWEASGIDYKDLIDRLIELAREKMS